MPLIHCIPTGYIGDRDGHGACVIRRHQVRHICQPGDSRHPLEHGVPASRLRPGSADKGDAQRGEQNQDKEATHGFQQSHTHILDIQALFLLEAVGVFNLGAQLPLLIAPLGGLSIGDGLGTQQHQGWHRCAGRSATTLANKP
jgi:hypothetical protein